MIRFPILLSLLAACATSPGAGADTRCVTPCGAWTRDGNCESLQRYERRVIRGIATVTEWTPGQLCAALRGWEIRVHPRDPVADKACPMGSWQRFPGYCVWGFTEPTPRLVSLHSSDWERTALAHEVVHVGDAEIGGPGRHCRWADPSLRAMVGQLQGEADESRPEPECSP
jgi:hypothetical protein